MHQFEELAKPGRGITIFQGGPRGQNQNQHVASCKEQISTTTQGPSPNGSVVPTRNDQPCEGTEPTVLERQAEHGTRELSRLRASESQLRAMPISPQSARNRDTSPFWNPNPNCWLFSFLRPSLCPALRHLLSSTSLAPVTVMSCGPQAALWSVLTYT